MTSTDTAASAMTWMTAARMLLSRAAIPCACSCSSKRTACVSPSIVIRPRRRAAREFRRSIPKMRRGRRRRKPAASRRAGLLRGKRTRRAGQGRIHATGGSAAARHPRTGRGPFRRCGSRSASIRRGDGSPCPWLWPGCSPPLSSQALAILTRKSEGGDRDRLAKMDRHGRDEAVHRLVADQERDHRQDDRAGETGQIAQLAGAEGEAGIVRMPAGEAVGQRGQQQRAGMGAHVQPVGDQRDRAEQPAADDLGRHHGAAQPDHRPGPALALLVGLAEEDMAMERRLGGAFGCAAFGLAHLRPALI